jgi:putative aldouronate transport system permease protein
MKHKKKINQSLEDRVFDIINYAVILIFSLLVFYPLYVVLISSISNPVDVALGRVLFFPKGFTFEGYKAVMEDRRITSGFLNSLFYVVTGTSLSVLVTILAGYAVSRKDLFGRKYIMLFFIFTMYFNGGLIPTFLLVKNLGLYDTRLIVILINLVMVYMLIISRTYYTTTISEELLEAARIDGCNDGHFLIHVVIPLSQSLTAVLILFYGVNIWNTYFTAFIYLREQAKWPLQLILRQILIMQQLLADDPNSTGEISDAYFQRAELVKFSLVIIASLPMLIVYPFVQKHFVKGVMIGSVKG